MKKRIPIIITALLLTIALTGCAAAMNDAAPASADYWSSEAMRAVTQRAAPTPPPPLSAPLASAPMEMPEMEAFAAVDMAVDMDQEAFLTGGTDGSTGILPIAAPEQINMAEKIIYTVNADIETVNFEESIAMVNTLMQRYGAFVENSSVSGVNHAAQFHGWQTFRNAWFSIRVPVGNLNAMSSSLDSIGNVTHLGNHATNITSQFIDTQSRLNSLTIQEERLLDMLRLADDVPDLIAIEERLGDVRHQIESLTTTINNWQNQIDFSTVTLNINEVEQLTEQPLIHRTYWQRIGDGFMSTIRGIGNFFSNAFMWIIISAPVLIILAILAIVIIIIIKWRIRVYRKNKPQKTNTYTPPPPPPTVTE